MQKEKYQRLTKSGLKYLQAQKEGKQKKIVANFKYVIP